MGIAMPEYDWELDEALEARIHMFRRMLVAMKDSGTVPCADGCAYMDQFYAEHAVPYPADPDDWYVDVRPLEANMLHDSLGFASMAETLAGGVVDYLVSMDALFPDEKWQKQINEEIRLGGLALERVSGEMRGTMAFHDPESLPFDDIVTYREFLDRMGFAQARYEGLVAERSAGQGGIPAASGLNRAFNIAGKQTMLSIETLRYATIAVTVAEDAMQVLLGIAVMPEMQRVALATRTHDLRERAERMMAVALAAMDEGRRLTRASYTTRDYNRPVFRSVDQVNRQYPGSGPQ